MTDTPAEASQESSQESSTSTVPAQRKTRGHKMLGYDRILDHHAMFWHVEDYKFFFRTFLYLEGRMKTFSREHSLFTLVDTLKGLGAAHPVDGKPWTTSAMTAFCEEHKLALRAPKDDKVLKNLKNIFNQVISYEARVSYPSKRLPQSGGKADRIDTLLLAMQVSEREGRGAAALYNKFENTTDRNLLTKQQNADCRKVQKLMERFGKGIHYIDPRTNERTGVAAWKLNMEYLYRRGSLFSDEKIRVSPVGQALALAATVKRPRPTEVQLELAPIVPTLPDLLSDKKKEEKSDLSVALQQIKHLCDFPGSEELKLKFINEVITKNTKG